MRGSLFVAGMFMVASCSTCSDDSYDLNNMTDLDLSADQDCGMSCGSDGGHFPNQDADSVGPDLPLLNDWSGPPEVSADVECQFEPECGDSGTCVGRRCFVNPCDLECEAGQICRAERTKSECVAPWSCPGTTGYGDATDIECRQNWDCDGNTMSMACKSADDDPETEETVVCTCIVNDTSFSSFRWEGFPCDGSINLQDFANTMCGWGLPPYEPE